MNASDEKRGRKRTRRKLTKATPGVTQDCIYNALLGLQPASALQLSKRTQRAGCKPLQKMATFQRPPTEALICSLVPAHQLEDVGIQTKCAFATQTPGELPVAQRMRAAYWLKHAYDNGQDESEKRAARRVHRRARPAPWEPTTFLM